jgi:hypothetical protein
MKRFIILLVLLAAGIAGLGCYLGWFHMTTETVDGKSNVTVTVDKDKIRADEQKAKDKVKEKAADTVDKVR